MSGIPALASPAVRRGTIGPLAERVADRPAVVVLRAASACRFVAVAEVLHQAGIRAIEITMTTPGAAAAIARVRDALPETTLIGAGTVRTMDHVREATDAGAEFLVSQLTHEPVIRAAAERGLPFIPGALTPNEIARAWDLGVSMVKVSPVGPAGGVQYVRELVGPLPEIPLFPTGGVAPEEMGDFLDAGAALVGLSGLLLLDALQPGGELTALFERTRSVVDALDARATRTATPSPDPHATRAPERTTT